MNDDPGSPAALGPRQRAREHPAPQVILRDNFPRPLSTVAGLAVSASGNATVAAAVVLEMANLSLVDSATSSIPECTAPDDATSRSLRALLGALSRLSTTPGLVLVQGDGIAHPQRFGLASQFGVAAELASIGVVEPIPLGQAAPLHAIRGAYTPLRDAGQQLGWLLRTQADDEPLVVSPAHKVAMASAADLVMRCVAKARWPEPLRLAMQLLAGTKTAPGVPGE
jgi:deoxyribonuclease V